MTERNICLVIAYDGFAYHGFQRQLNAQTIQQVLEERLAILFGHSLKVTGAARTDAGVHAQGQVINFSTDGRIPVERIPFAAKSVLPDDIVVKQATEVPPSFHARFAAKSKLYEYTICNTLLPDPFMHRYSWHVSSELNVAAMQQAVQYVIGEHDFSSFKAAGGAIVNPVRRILHAECKCQDELIICRFHGTGFLYHMVRNLVGTLMEIGLNKIGVSDMPRILAARDRNVAGITAPPNGLCLRKVYYE